MADQRSSGRDGRSADRSSEAEEVRVGWKMAGLGMEVGAQAMGGALLGWLFDRWRGHGNIGVIVGAGIGIVTGLWSLIRGGLKLNRQLDEAAERKKRQGRADPTPPPATAEPDRYVEHQTDDDTWNDWDDDSDNRNDADDRW